MFDQDADEALVAAEDRAVEHDRPVALAVLADIARIESFGQHAVGLDRADLPGAPDRVGQMPFELGGVEGDFAGQLRRSEEHTSELQSLMRISYAVFCLKKKNNIVQYNIRKEATI